MTNKIFGNWIVNDCDIMGLFPYNVTYRIRTNDIWQLRNYAGHLVYDWLLICQGKTFISLENVKDFNEAFKYSIEHFKFKKPSNIPEASLPNSLFIQQRLLSIDLNPQVSDLALFGDDFFNIHTTARKRDILQYERDLYFTPISV